LHECDEHREGEARISFKEYDPGTRPQCATKLAKELFGLIDMVEDIDSESGCITSVVQWQRCSPDMSQLNPLSERS
jgi:hypothetical protein